MRTQESSARRARRVFAAVACVAVVAAMVTAGTGPAGIGPAADVAGGAPPRWLVCGIAVIGTVVNLFIPSPVAGVYAAAWAAIARGHCT